MNKKHWLKIIISFILGICASSIIFSCIIFIPKDIPYLNEEQNETIKSVRVVKNTNDTTYELNYTADYKSQDLINKITKDKMTSAYEVRAKMKDLLAPKSKVYPEERLSNWAPGCSSLICKNSDGDSVIGRNYDLDNKSNGLITVIHTTPENGYKSVGISDGAQFGLSFNDLKNNNTNKELFLYAPYFTMDGVNEAGFACSIMVLNEGANVQETGKNWLPSTMIVRYLLDHANSVDNAIELLNKHDYRNDYFVEPWLADLNYHWALTDSSGNKAIIEYINGKLNINKYPLKVQYNETNDTMKIQYPKQETNYLLSTNFYVTEGYNNTAHDAGKWRYQILEEQISKNPHPTNNELKNIMKNAKYFMNDKDHIWQEKNEGHDPTKEENWDWETIWTDILNTNNKNLILYVKENYNLSNTFQINYN